jgi:hypothetical protein
MKLIKQSDAINIVKKSLDDALSDEQIGHINDMLTDATYKYNSQSGMDYFCIHDTDIPDGKGFPLQMLASMLSSAGWKATYKYCQRDGDWVNIELPKVGR